MTKRNNNQETSLAKNLRNLPTVEELRAKIKKAIETNVDVKKAVQELEDFCQRKKAWRKLFRQTQHGEKSWTPKRRS